MRTQSLFLASVFAVIALLSIPLLFAHADTYPQLVSVATDGTQANRFSQFDSPGGISADGRYVVFNSYASNLVPNDTNGTSDTFRHDTLTGSTTRVSVASDGTQLTEGSRFESMSADGRYVVFGVGGYTYVHDMMTGSTTPISSVADANGAYIGGGSTSADGRYVAYDAGGIFLRDNLTGSTTQVDVAADGTPGNGVSSGDLSYPPMSADGRYVAFLSSSSNLVPNDTNGLRDVFLHDNLTGGTTLVSVASDGTQANQNAQRFSMSADARYIAWVSNASNLVPNGTNGKFDIFVHDMLTGNTAQVDVAADGTQANGNAWANQIDKPAPAISADGRYVAFFSGATNLVSNDTNGTFDIFVARNPLTNQAPVLDPIGNKTVNEGQNLSFTLSATDPDSGDTLTYSASNLPPGATFDPVTRTFSWTPDYTQAGNYPNVEFTVMDNGSPMMLDFEDITITVGNVNRPPIFSNPGPQQVLEHNSLTFSVSATDPDGDAVTLSASGMPSGATFDPATGIFSWTPGYPTAGVYTPTFTATDNGTPVATSSIDVVITVGSNPTPTEQAQTTVDTVVAANLPTNTENSYLANLNKVGTFIQNGNVQAAINQLNAFIQKVNQDYSHGTITLAEKNQFVTVAQNLINALQ